MTYGSSQRRVAFWSVLAFLWAVFIFFMSAHTGNDLDQGTGIISHIKRWLVSMAATIVGPDVDVISPLAHFVEYAIFGAILFSLLLQIRRYRKVRSLVLQGQMLEDDVLDQGGVLNATGSLGLLVVGAVVIASLYGITDEFHQEFVPGRMADPVDWIVDTCGSAFGALLLGTIHRFKA